MAIKVFGKVAVPSAGTPVPISATTFMCNQLIITGLDDNTKGFVVGDKDMVVATMVNCMSPKLSAGQGIVMPPNSCLGNHIDCSQVYIDTEVNDEGVVAYAVY